MLRELRLKNLAVIESAELEFGEGFTVLTGETGAGKSLLVGALSLVLGGRASADVIRSGAEEAIVEAAYEPGENPEVAAALEEAGIPVEPTLIVRRIISKSGRNRIYLNGAMAPAGLLARVGEAMIGIFGQNEFHGLLRTETQRRLLDLFAGHDELLTRMESAWEELRNARERLAELSGDEEERVRRIDYLRFLLDELEAAALEEGEEETLAAEREELAGAEKMVAAASRGIEALYEGPQAFSGALAHLETEFARLGPLNEDMAEAARLLGEAGPLLDEAARSLQRVAARFGEDPEALEARLNQVEERLEVLSRLKRKHAAGAVADLIARREEIAGELASLESYDSQLSGRREELERTEKAARAAAEELSASRIKAARALAREVGAELDELNMKGTRLEVRVEPGKDPGPAGFDRVEYLLSANPGEEPRPLAKVASGGELSRVLLALRLVLTEPGQVRTLILDEVDAGIGGVTADVVGRKIARLGKDFQVVCITHLPQIACRAEHHLRVSKQSEGKRTSTLIEELSAEERIDEISRMLGGTAVTERVRETARELIAGAREG